jgi:hypothetical protein
MAGRIGPKSKFTLKLAEEICDRVSNDETLRSICSDPHMPSPVTIWNWQRKHPEFREAYDQAQRNRAHAIADEASETRKQLWVSDMSAVRANALLNIIKWETAVRNPAVYGGKAMAEPETESEPQHDYSKLSTEELETLARLLAKAEPGRSGS